MNSFMGWIGGKKLLREAIVQRFPVKFGRYIEVCGGAGWVLFSRNKHAALEVYNDANGDLVNLFRCIKYHCNELQRELSYMLNSRELFEGFKAQCYIKGMTDIQRAARFFMLIKTSYGSDIRSFGCVKKDIGIMIKYLDSIQERLLQVVIENKSYQDIIKVYDKPDALFYIDPPYYGTEKYYSEAFTVEDHIQLCNMLNEVKGKFVLSYNDCEYIRKLYSKFFIEQISRNHNLAGRYKTSKYNELIIKNY